MRQKRAQISAFHSFHDVNGYASLIPHTSSDTTLEIVDR